jgi:hypothetical protein
MTDYITRTKSTMDEVDALFLDWDTGSTSTLIL